jgi:hypothetical protein
MAMVDIQSLFQDIIESPRQLQRAMQEQGQREAQITTNALSGRSQIFAPLVSQLAASQGSRDEMLQRSVGGLFGLDTRNESEKLQQVLQGADTKTPEGQAAMLQGLRDIGMADRALQLEQMFAAQAAAEADKQRILQQEAEDRVRNQSAQDLQAEVSLLNMESTRQQMAIRDANLSAQEEARALAEAAREAQSAQQAALAAWFDAKGNPEIAELAAMGVINSSNFTNFTTGDRPQVLSKGAVLVDAAGNIIASNNEGTVQAAKDYSLTGPEIATYAALIRTNADIKEVFEEPRFFNWSWTSKSNEDKQRILIDEAERIRTNNPEISREAALRQAIERNQEVSSQSQSLPVVATQEEYDSIPSGASYRDPQGIRRIKQ